MKRFDARKGWAKLPGDVRNRLGRITMDLAVAHINIAMIETAQAASMMRELPADMAAVLRASNAVVINATAEIAGIISENTPALAAQLPVVPRGLGRVCHFCGCSELDACVGTFGTCGWVDSVSIPLVRDVCSFCHAKGLADGTEDRQAKTAPELRGGAPDGGNARRESPDEGAAAGPDQDGPI